MMEQTNSAEVPSINNVRPFLSHFYQPTFLLCPIIFKAVQNGSCQEIIRQLSQICQAFISKVIRQLSGSCQTAITKLSGLHHESHQAVVRKIPDICQAIIWLSSSSCLLGSCQNVFKKSLDCLSQSCQAIITKVIR